MTETNAERLERLKNINDIKHVVALNHPSNDGNNTWTIDLERDVDWLIEQAELRQIENQASVLANKMNTAFTKEVMDKNERLCEALEGLLHIEAVTQPSDYEELLKKVREYVVEALEESK